MTREDIIRMVKEASGDRQPDGWGVMLDHEQLERFAKLVAAAEREACAVIAFNAKTYIEAANAIRARGENSSLVVHPSDDDWYYANKLKANND